jgi:hypothetical protein
MQITSGLLASTRAMSSSSFGRILLALKYKISRKGALRVLENDKLELEGEGEIKGDSELLGLPRTPSWSQSSLTDDEGGCVAEELGAAVFSFRS